jgi:xanthine/CO dehydrogenase XdhC/CoxF family maturation factor
MAEREQIVALASRSKHRGEAGVLVTLVRAEGSSYRRPGARLLTAGGLFAGTISGGCLETQVVKKAAWSVREGAVVERYSTLFDDTAEIPYGLGCGGTVDLLLERAGTAEFEALLRAMEASLGGERSRVVTWLPAAGRPLRRAVLADAGEVLYRSEGLDAAEIADALLAEMPEVFDEWLTPPQRLVVLGAGDDAKPVVSMAALLGWNVTVVDGRAQLARTERFPEAERVLVAGAAEIATLGIEADSAVVLMTHSYEQDREWLAALLPFAPRYLGVLGARHRSSLLVSEAAVMTGLSVEDCCARIYAPVGLDLGGDGPEAIALAVIAEVQACCMGRLGRSRRLSVADVAEQIERGGASRYMQAQCGLDFSLSEDVAR